MCGVGICGDVIAAIVAAVGNPTNGRATRCSPVVRCSKNTPASHRISNQSGCNAPAATLVGAALAEGPSEKGASRGGDQRGDRSGDQRGDRSGEGVRRRSSKQSHSRDPLTTLPHHMHMHARGEFVWSSNRLLETK